MAAVGDEVEGEAEGSDLRREFPHLLLGHARGVPVEGRRQVVGQHLVWQHRMDGLGELGGIGQVGGLGLHPDQVAVGGRGKRLGDGVGDAATHLVVALGGLGDVAIPHHVDLELEGPGSRFGKTNVRRKSRPFVDADSELFTVGNPLLHGLGHGLGIRGQAGGLFPCSEDRIRCVVEHVIGDVLGTVEPRRGRFGDRSGHARRLHPRLGFGVGSIGHRVELVANQFIDPGSVERPGHGQEHLLVARNCGVGGTEDERLIALVGAAVEQVGCFSIGAGNDDSRHAHDVELETGRVESLDLLVGADQHFAALMSTLLHAGLLVFDVIPRHSDLDEAANQVAHVGVAAVAGVGIGDDERAVVVNLRGGPLLRAHALQPELLVLVGCQQGTHENRGLIGDLAQRVTREVGARVFVDGALGRCGPTTEVDPLDAHALHRRGLARCVRAKGGNALVLVEQFAESVVEALGRLACHRVVTGDRAPLLGYLTGRIQAGGRLEAATRHPLFDLGDLIFERRHNSPTGLPPAR